MDSVENEKIRGIHRHIKKQSDVIILLTKIKGDTQIRQQGDFIRPSFII
jgi:hypothetical protein